MSQEIYEFWKMAFASPAIVALASGVAGACSVLLATLCKSRHDAKESQKIWERQEKTRKEQRLFELKLKAYENFTECFYGLAQGNAEIFCKNIIPAIIRLVNYGSQETKEKAKQFMNLLIQIREATAPQKNEEVFQNLITLGNELHDTIIVDIAHHH